MTELVLHYIYDPLCGWCYAAEPMVLAVVNAGITVKLHGGGLWDNRRRLDAATRSHIRQSDARIAALTGQVFGTPYLDGLLADPAVEFWSRPTIAAVLAAESIDRAAPIRMMTAIQHAHYVEGRRVVDEGTLVSLAGSLGLNEAHFSEALQRVPVDDHIHDTRALMEAWNLRGYPSFLVARDGVLQRAPHESYYADPASFLTALDDHISVSG